VTADYSRKIIVVTSGIFATGFKKFATREILRQSRPINVVVLIQTLKVPPPKRNPSITEFPDEQCVL
jgi:predicted phosphoribosyltransferase